MRLVNLAFVALAALLLTVVPQTAASDHRAGDPAASSTVSPLVQVVFFGSTSNLAKKYLWQTYLELWDALYPATLEVVGVGRDSEEKGLAKVRDIVLANTTCGAGVKTTDEHCTRLRESFLRNVKFVSLAAGDAGYAALGDVMRTAAAHPGYTGRLFYMAVASDLVPEIVHKIRTVANVELVSEGSKPYNRIIVEKPLGSDMLSSQTVLGAVMAHFSPDSVHVIDHYLGKTGLSIAAGFRSRMMAQEPWVRQLASMAYSEVYALEDETVEGRTGYFNSYGLMRDMVQNHVTQMIIAAGLLPQTGWDTHGRETMIDRINANIPAGEMETTDPSSESCPLRLLQYKGYKEHVAADRAASKDKPVDYTVARECRKRGYDSAGSVRPECAAVLSHPPDIYEKYGDNFTTFTAATFPVEILHAPAFLTVGKATGMRTAFVRHVFVPERATFCGPITMTYHIQGRLVLPAGVNTTGLPFDLPDDYPAIVLTGACGYGLRDPMEVLEPSSWPFSWEVAHSPEHGIWIAKPAIEPWASAVIDRYRFVEKEAALAAEVAAAPSATPAAASGAEEVVEAVDEDEGDEEDAEDAPAPKAVPLSRLSSRLLQIRLQQLSEAPGKGGAAAYKNLIAASLLGQAHRFVSMTENHRLWTAWERFIDVTDAAAAAGKVSIYEPGDRSWMRTLAPSDIKYLDSRHEQQSDAALQPDAAGGDNLLLRRTDKAGKAWNKFAADFATAMWAMTPDRPGIHVVLDAGYDLEPVYSRLTQMDAAVLTPWPGAIIWQTRERSTQPGARQCAMGHLVNQIFTKLRIQENRVNPQRHPNMTHINALSKRVLKDNRFEIVVVAFPSGADGPTGLPAHVRQQQGVGGGNTQGALPGAAVNNTELMFEYALGYHPEALPLRTDGEIKGPLFYDSVTLGDDERDNFVSTGLGLEEAAEQEAEARKDPSFQPPRNRVPTEINPADLPPGVTPEMVSPFRDLPPPPVPFRGEIDVRLSSKAVRDAYQVFVVLPASVVRRYGGLEPVGATATVGSDGSLTATVTDAHGEQMRLPAALEADVRKLVAHRTLPFRVYVVEES